MPDARVAFLQNISLFAAVSSDSLELLLERIRQRHVAQGAYFFREGDEGASIFVLEKGRVSILKHWQGEDYLINAFGAGDFFGEIALLDCMPRSASVIAEEDCHALELRASDVLELAGRDLEQFTMIYMNIAREIARRLRHANQLLFEGRLRYQDFAAGYDFST